MLAHWYTLLLLPDDEPPATGPREVWRADIGLGIIPRVVLLTK